ncbi:alpha/beta fold hydrolase [Paenibacillus gansuensis]|uniref:Alpha/beta fold hydrolase n=1 Tax=Paenibacillus gansuensis TaxID=306542 RepID=A0ABW5PJS0_9BACL
MNQSIIARNHVNISGKGSQYILFAPGFGCDQQMWRFAAPAFEEDYRVVLFDYVGSGKSDLSAYDPERYSGLSGYAQDVLDICHALDVKDAILVGHSVGAMIGILASIREPWRFSRLVLIGPSARYINDMPNYIGGFDKKDIDELIHLMKNNDMGWSLYLAPAVMGNPDRPDLSLELQQSFCAIDPVIARRFAEATFYADNRADLSKVTVPALILQCSQDAIAPLEAGEYVHSQMAGSTLQRMQATGHCPHMSAPEETVSRIKEYLTRTSPTASSKEGEL